MTPPLPTLRLLLLFSALASASGPPATADSSVVAVHFPGVYRYADGPVGEARLRATVDRMVDRFNPLLRGIARSRLERTVRVPVGVTIALEPAGLAVEVLGAPGFGGDVALEEGVLVQRQSNFEGTRTTRFVLSPDGRHLTMWVITRSALLPDDLSYSIHFEREADAIVGAGPPESGAGG